MRPFTYQRISDAAAVAHISAGAVFLAGGTTLLDLMKLDVMRPDVVIDINDLQAKFGQVEQTGAVLRLGALARMEDVASDPVIIREYPIISQSLTLAASAQLRNMATLGGNVLQRTRCSYFRDVTWNDCNKRNPGSGCAALEGVNRKHAVLGASSACIAAYPGDFAQALIALDANVELVGPTGVRCIAFADLHVTPEKDPSLETVLRPGELITSFVVSPTPFARRSMYLKIRDRESYEFALASAAVALDLDGKSVREARIALGGVATKPWRAKPAEQSLTGRPIDEKSARAAAEIAFASAIPHDQNAYKIELGKRTLVRALLETATMEV